ncbi:EAL domain-containing protein [Massilia sp. PWRC2]|uniref:putative bifunctional diguanylate cyclase/phosphodiesterase n=1 Tax=Massilia sp. PWRC2 TaxID=2804626 RepID=UPI003CE7E7E3
MSTANSFIVDELLLDNFPAGVVVHDANSAVLTANVMAERLLGLSAQHMMGLKVDDVTWQFVQPDGSPMAPADFPAARALHGSCKISDLVLGVDTAGLGGIRWLLCSAYPVFNGAAVLTSVVVCFTDCSDLIRAQKALSDSEQRLQLVLRGSNDGCWDWDLANQRIYYSPRWWAMLGYEPGELTSGPALWEQLLHADDRQRVQHFLGAALAGAVDDYAIEFSLLHREGHYVPVQSRGFIQRGPGGTAIRVAGTNTDITERKQFERQLLTTAEHDHLTGLPNRRYLSRELATRLAAARAAATHGAVLLLDLDDFKLINDTEGHSFGDLLLQEVAARLRASMGAVDFVGRLGGDEFVVILAPTASTLAQCSAEAERHCQQLRLALCRPYRLAGSEHTVTPSIGCALFDASTAAADLVFKQADIALYAAKGAGRNTVRFFDPAMQHAIDARARLQGELHDAIARAELEIYYQPQFDVMERLIGAEALLRWNHTVRGVVTPGAFIAVAEMSDLIIRIGDWVLRDASARLATWARDPALSGLTLSVNVSARHLHEDDFVARTLAILRQAGADPHRLAMELTESLLATDAEETIAKMRQLRECGVNFSIDDFGTGFSSLRYIHRFPLKHLKIDQSFVAACNADPNAAAIVEIVIALANKLGLGHVAEGVETPEQLAFLKSLGCTGFQGYLLGRPMPAAQFEALARAQYACTV